MELRILATGYGHFEDYPTDESNPANKVAMAFKGEYLEGDQDKPEVKGYHVIVPVVWDKAWPVIKNAIEEFKPDLLICMGASDETQFERVARNEACGIPDAEGKCFDKPYVVDASEYKYSLKSNISLRQNRIYSDDDYRYKPLVKYADGEHPPYLFLTTLPCDYLEDKMNNTSNPNILRTPNLDRPSSDAGGYLCNLAFYMPALLLRQKVHFTGFLHVEPGKKDEVYKETGKFIFQECAQWLQQNYIRYPYSDKTNKSKQLNMVVH